ncbi:MAG: hypothetical protein RL693_2027 [Verrucomicrobiota bacterium]|jgi:membrane-associated phospholipid phosphatase
MKHLATLLFAVCTCLITSCAGTAGTSDTETQNRWLVVLGSYQDFPEAKRDAESYAKASGVPFSMNGMVFDQKGLHLPDNDPDQIYAGDYLLRRFNTASLGDQVLMEHLSIEKSGSYAGFPSGHYIIVASVAGSPKEASLCLKRFKKIAPNAYVKKTPIFLGCMH